MGVNLMNDNLTTLSRNLRKQQTDAERLLWNKLRAKQINNVKFRRQQPIGKYIVDFVSFEKKIIIEVDGGQHMDNSKDRGRDEWLEKEGFKVLRFWNNEILLNMEGALEVIRERCI